MRKEASFSKLPKAVRQGFRKLMADEKPFLLGPVNWAAKKILNAELKTTYSNYVTTLDVQNIADDHEQNVK